MQKVRHIPLTAFLILFQDLFHSILYGSFHHSLAVLLHYQSLIYIFSLKVVLQISRFFLYFLYLDRKFFNIRDNPPLYSIKSG